MFALAALTALLPGLMGSEALAQGQSLRASFPGRRIGGGTRAECASRLLVHLVPTNSVYAAGQPVLLGLLQGPALEPMPLELAFRPYPAAGGGGGQPPDRALAAAPAGLTLLQLDGLAAPTVWASHYRCGPLAASDDALAFAVTTAPPALSLLLPPADSTAADRSVQLALAQLQKSCGGTVAREQLARSFGLEDLLGVGWPAQLPVRCL